MRPLGYTHLPPLTRYPEAHSMQSLALDSLDSQCTLVMRLVLVLLLVQSLRVLLVVLRLLLSRLRHCCSHNGPDL